MCDVLWHLSRSVAHSSLIFQAPPDSIFPSQLWSSSRALPLHLHFATARMFSVSPLLLTCPNHSSLLRLITVAIASTFASSNISSFLRCSNRLTPIAHRTILISVVAIRFSSLTGIVNVSQPYSNVGRITVGYRPLSRKRHCNRE